MSFTLSLSLDLSIYDILLFVFAILCLAAFYIVHQTLTPARTEQALDPAIRNETAQVQQEAPAPSVGAGPGVPSTRLTYGQTTEVRARARSAFGICEDPLGLVYLGRPDSNVVPT